MADNPLKNLSPGIKIFLIFAISVPEMLLGWWFLSGQSDPWHGARSFPIRGVVEELGPGPRMVVLRHEDVPGLMPAMTMPFEVGSEPEFRGIKVGDSLEATFQVMRGRSRLDRVRVTGHGARARRAGSRPGLDSLPQATLLDSRGRRFTPADFRGKALAVAFFYTRCPVPEACPRLATTLGEAQRELASSGDLAARVHLLMVSLDPVYDTPARIAEYEKTHHVDPAIWTVATGDPAEARAFRSRQGVRVEGEGPAMNHENAVFVYRPDGVLQRRIEGTHWSAHELVGELRAALAGSPGPQTKQNGSKGVP